MIRSIFYIAFIGILISVITIFGIRTDVTTEYGIQSTKYAQHLTKACQDAVTCVKKDNETIDDSKKIYGNDTLRNKAVEAFFDSLENGFNYVNDSNRADALKIHVPVLCLIDSDGYYICYNNEYAGDNGLETGIIISPINTWGMTGENEAFSIRFYLSDYVQVVKNETGEIKGGKYKDIYEYFGKPVGLESFVTEEVFQSTKKACIVQETEKQIENYINRHNYTVNNYKDSGSKTDFGRHYTFTLPEISEEDWGNLIAKPTDLAFLQGIQVQNENKYLNIYAMAGGELLKEKKYYINLINEDLTYHKKDCSLLVGTNNKSVNSKEECVKEGSFPCQECKP